RVRQVVFFAEPAELPIRLVRSVPAATVAVAPRQIAVASEAVGIDPNTTLTAVSPRSFAARGCVFQALTTFPDPVNSLDTLTGEELLEEVPTFRIHFPAVLANGTVVLCCEAVCPEAGPAVDQIRWLSIDAALGSLRTVVQPDRVAFTMSVIAN